jgi:peptidoglycan/LPS O-acetylase OafA/YrhL
VDLFFCISGYVVSKSFVGMLDQYKETGNFWLAAQCFWIRRFFRLTPSAWLWVAIGILCSLFFNTTGSFGTLYQNLRSATAVITLSANLANQFGQFGHVSILGPNIIYWSLALEEQFYLCFPLFLLIVPGAWRWCVLLLLIAIQFPIDRNSLGNPVSALLASFRLDALMWGILIYLFSKSPQYRLFEPTFLKTSKVKTLTINLLFFYLLGAIAGQMIAMPIVVGLVAVVSALLVLMASYQSGYICNIPFLSGALAWLGARSYAIYLIHFPAYRFCFEGWTRYAIRINHPLDGTFTLRMLLSAIVLTLVFAELNFRLVENPLRRIGAEIAARRLQLFGTTK